MRISDSLVENLLDKSGKVSKEQLATLHEQETNEKKPLQDLIIRNNLLTDKELTQLYAAEIDIPYVELNAKEIKHDVLKLLPERIARQYKAVVFNADEQGI